MPQTQTLPPASPRPQRRWLTRLCAGLLGGLMLASAPAPLSASPVDKTNAKGSPTLDAIRIRNSLRCGVNPYAGLALADPQGKWSGFHIEWCRALAAATLGDANLFTVVPVEATSRFNALRDGDIDVLLDSTTMTMGRDIDQGMSFTVPTLYDGQGFIAYKDTGITSMRDGKNVTPETRICVIENTTSLENLRDFLKTRNLPAKAVILRSDDGAWGAFLKRRCDIYTSDLSGLALRMQDKEALLQGGLLLLPDVISKEPVAPSVREGDHIWETVVRWTVYGLISAEEEGITSANVDSFANTSDTDVMILLGKANDHAAGLGLAPGWLQRAVKQVGNYGEIYNRTLGANSPYKIERGLNRQWTEGGLLYAPPLR